MTDTELTTFGGVGRRYRHHARVHLADAAPDGRARFDALARWLQDAAYDDVLDGGAAEDGAWVVRSAELRVTCFPRFGEALTLDTWCDGLGRTRLWARRRTSLEGEHGARVEAVATWVHLDPETGRPRPLSEQQLALWLPSTEGREVKARLTHPTPPEDVTASSFAFRAADLDVAQHVNNAAYWAVLEETVAAQEPMRATIEHATASLPGPVDVVRAEDTLWIGRSASIRVDPRRTLVG